MYSRHMSRGKSGGDRFYSAVKAAQEETIRRNLERSTFLVEADVEAAWKVLVPSGEQNVTRSELMERLAPFMPHVDLSVVTHLAGGGGSMTYDKLLKLLMGEGGPQLPLHMSSEAWALVDPHGRGSIGLDTLLRMLSTIPGCERLDGDDLRVIRLLLDVSPEDFAVSEENFEQLGSWAPQIEELTPAQRKLLAARAAQASAVKGPGSRGRRTPVPR